MLNKRLAVRLSLVGLLGMAMMGCEGEGPAERAGKEIDKAMDSANETMTSPMPEGPMEKAGQDIDQAVDAAKESMPGMAPEGAMEQAGKAVDEAVEATGEKIKSVGEDIKEQAPR